jgi:hypothetical protein
MVVRAAATVRMVMFVVMLTAAMRATAMLMMLGRGRGFFLGSRHNVSCSTGLHAP